MLLKHWQRNGAINRSNILVQTITIAEKGPQGPIKCLTLKTYQTDVNGEKLE